jgi:signal transduction histidine kinase
MEQFQSLLSLESLSPAESIRALGYRAMAGEEQVIEMAFQNREGANLICEVRLARLPSAKHQVIRASFMDISERRQAEKRHLEYQRRLRSLASELALTEERERKRIAMYLHDEVAQDLVATQMKLSELASEIDNKGVGQKIEIVQKMLGSAIEDTYTLTFELSLPILYELGLVPAIEWLGEKICESEGIRFRLIDDGLPKPLSNDIRSVCFDVTRELLRNVVKHAKASEASVTVRTEGAHLWIVIQDNGVGFDVAELTDMKRKDGGFGMFCVRERLENLHGSIRMESECGHGTRVTFCAPLSDAGTETGCDPDEN